MIVYGSSLSPFVRKVLAYAAEKGVEVELAPTGLKSEDDGFREASPFGKMPALRDGDFTLADSSAIVAYLEALHPEPALIPADPRARGRTIWFEEYADSILGGVLLKIFFNRLVAPRFLNQPGDETIAAAAEADELPPVLDYLERELAQREWLVGDALTLADVAVASPLVNLGHLGLAPSPDRHPNVAAFRDRMLARPSFRPWVEKETAFLARTAPQSE